MGLKWLVLVSGPLYLTGLLLSEDQRANIIKKTCIQKIGLQSIDINKYFTLNSAHNWEDIYSQLSNQQTFDNHN